MVSFSLALQQEVAETESKEDLASHLPPCNPGANIPENVYLFDDRILHFLYDSQRCDSKNDHYVLIKIIFDRETIIFNQFSKSYVQRILMP